jgi:hypothetical protein
MLVIYIELSWLVEIVSLLYGVLGISTICIRATAHRRPITLSFLTTCTKMLSFQKPCSFLVPHYRLHPPCWMMLSPYSKAHWTWLALLRDDSWSNVPPRSLAWRTKGTALLPSTRVIPVGHGVSERRRQTSA